MKITLQTIAIYGTDKEEVRLGSYELFHRGEPLTETVWEKLMLGLSTRKYGQAIRQFREAYGLEKSAVSEHFIEASRTKLKDLMERGMDFSEPRLYVLDGGRALHTAVKKYAGESAPIQRCQVHIAGRDPRLPEGWKVPSRASPCAPGSLGSGMTG